MVMSVANNIASLTAYHSLARTSSALETSQRKLATGLRIVRGAVPELAGRAGALYDSMDFGFYYVPSVNRILFNYSPAQGTGPCCYDTVVSESRIADYIGITKGDLPAKEYYGRWRTFPDTCDYSFQETRPSGFYRTYAGVRVYDGSYPYNGTHITPCLLYTSDAADE